MPLPRFAALSLSIFIAAGSAEAAVSYRFYEGADASTPLVLGFETADQVSPTSSLQPITNLLGQFAEDFQGSMVEYFQGAPDYQPRFVTSGTMLGFSATLVEPAFPFGNPANGVPGPGTYEVDGFIIDLGDDAGTSVTVASAVIAELPSLGVAEPATLALFGVGLLGLAALRRREVR